MKHKLVTFALVLAATLSTAFPLMAAVKGSVVVELKGFKVSKAADGKETFVSAEKAKPGDVIEYRAVYRNKGKEKVTNVKGIIPVPKGTEFVPGSAKPAQITASLDDKEYAPLPLKRKVILPSGKEEMQNVPYEEYRFIRWDLKSLDPGKSSSVSMRVKVSTETPKP